MNRADLLRLAEAAIPEDEGTLSGDLEAAIDAIEPAIRADERARIVKYLRESSGMRPAYQLEAVIRKIEEGNPL